MQTRFRLLGVFSLACLGTAAWVSPVAGQSFFLPQPRATAGPIMLAMATTGGGVAGRVSRTTLRVHSITAADAAIVAGLDAAFEPLALEHRKLALEAGLPFEFVSGRRSRSRQAALAADRTRTRPAAPPGRSKHEVGLAYDLRASGLTPAQLQRLGELGESIGLRWGGRFTPRPDPNHFEAWSPRPVAQTSRRGLPAGQQSGGGRD